ncbi:DUF2231 domain-containing protein, partial [Micromonospora sp. NPDC049559]|uniref:DUF2231 domain-containing protein n=1 Tax=Micromonospora sp. NPDC049559 TaxID=3155923 RepID=UPI00343A4663
MDSRLRVQGHSIQPMLVTFPYGLFVWAVIFDLSDLVGGPAFLGELGYLTAVAALVAAALTAVAGMVDLWDVPNDRTRRTAITFNLINGAVAVLFVFCCLVRSRSPEHAPTGGTFAVELLALAVGAVGVRLGTVLVRRFDRDRTEATTLDALGTASPAPPRIAFGRARMSRLARGVFVPGQSRRTGRVARGARAGGAAVGSAAVGSVAADPGAVTAPVEERTVPLPRPGRSASARVTAPSR